MTGDLFLGMVIGAFLAGIAFGALGLYLYERRQTWRHPGSDQSNMRHSWRSNDASDRPAGSDSPGRSGRPWWH